MPNWVDNTLKLNKKYKSMIVNSNGNVDFNMLISMPEELNITSGSIEKKAMAVYMYEERGDSTLLKTIQSDALSYNWKDYPKTLEGIKEYEIKNYSDGYTECKKKVEKRAENWDLLEDKLKEFEKYPTLIKLGERYILNKEQYGSTTWYDWRRNNWGCKWNAGSSYVEEIGDEIVCHFNTPWNTPLEWLESLYKNGIPFQCYWVEEQGFRGCISSDGYYFNNESMSDLEWDDDECDWKESLEDIPTIYDSNDNLVKTVD